MMFEEEELIGTFCHSWGQSTGSDQRTYLTTGGNFEWFSKRKVRLPINSGLYVGFYFKATDNNMEAYLAGISTVYKKVA